MLSRLVVLLVFLLLPSPAQAIEMGTVHVLHVHPTTGTDYYDISVQLDRGGRCPVSRNAKPDARFQEGDRVQVTRATPPCTIAPLQILKAGAQAARVAGVQPTLVILVTFTNDRTEGQTRATFQSWVPYLDRFIGEQSYGTVSVPTDVVGWYPLALANTGCAYWSIQAAADRAATAAGVNLAAYMRRVYVFPYTTQCAWSGLGTIGGNPSFAWVNGPGSWIALNHEVGHTLGLYHSHGLRCGTWPTGTPLTPPCRLYEYGDIRDTMGGSGGPFNAFQKLRLGWLGQSGVPPVTVVSQPGDYTISEIEGPLTAVSRALVIPRGTGEMFYVEQHVAAPGRMVPGVYIHLAHPSLPDSSKFLDMTPTISFGLASGLPVGATFTDPASTVRISTVSADAAGAVIRVALGAPPPPPPPPPPPGDGTVTITRVPPLGREMVFSGVFTGVQAITASVDSGLVPSKYVTVDSVRKTWSARAVGLFPGPHVFSVSTGTMSASVAFTILR